MIYIIQNLAKSGKIETENISKNISNFNEEVKSIFFTFFETIRFQEVIT